MYEMHRMRQFTGTGDGREVTGGWREEGLGVTVQWVQSVFRGDEGFGNGGRGGTAVGCDLCH